LGPSAPAALATLGSTAASQKAHFLFDSIFSLLFLSTAQHKSALNAFVPLQQTQYDESEGVFFFLLEI
jgi:hypothetical protein